ncbi:MAG: helix-turn-helix transcriptional regulator [Clostridia bacterium]|nr:helix-turn-helix transcriptional regulator [Clostridia bacterium]
MISFAPFYDTLKKRGITTYKLIKDYNVSRSLIDRLKHNKPISTVTIDDLCKMLSCKVEEILVFVDEE